MPHRIKLWPNKNGWWDRDVMCGVRNCKLTTLNAGRGKGGWLGHLPSTSNTQVILDCRRRSVCACCVVAQISFLSCPLRQQTGWPSRNCQVAVAWLSWLQMVESTIFYVGNEKWKWEPRKMKSAMATATAILRSDVKWIPLQVVRKIQELMPK